MIYKYQMAHRYRQVHYSRVCWSFLYSLKLLLGGWLWTCLCCTKMNCFVSSWVLLPCSEEDMLFFFFLRSSPFPSEFGNKFCLRRGSLPIYKTNLSLQNLEINFLCPTKLHKFGVQAGYFAGCFGWPWQRTCLMHPVVTASTAHTLSET